MSSEAAAAAAPTVADDELIYDMLSVMRLYRSGRVERFEPFKFVPPSADPETGVESEDIVLNCTTGIYVRVYRPRSATINGNFPILVFYHGGGFCVHRASSANYHNYLNFLTAKANIIAVSVDYRLAPEHPLPAAYDDSWEALQWVLGRQWGGEVDCSRVILAGSSAGANIAHNMSMRLGREGRKVEGMVLMNPYFWGKERIGVELEKDREGAKLKLADVDPAWAFLCPETTGSDDPRLNPVAEGAPSLVGLGCRRVLVGVGDRDLFVERARLYCEKLKESGWGGEVELMVAEGEDHGFFMSHIGNDKAKAFMEAVVSFCNKV